MSKEKSQSRITEDSKEMSSKRSVKDYSDEELDAMGWEEEAKLMANDLLDGINDTENHGKSN